MGTTLQEIGSLGISFQPQMAWIVFVQDFRLFFFLIIIIF